MADTDDQIELRHVLSLLVVAASLLASTDDVENNPFMLGYKVVDLHSKEKSIS